MSIDRSRRITFEEIADLYDEVRPGYPEELVDDVVALSGIAGNGRILEIGCGPGNATIPFARRGYAILAIELGARLAALAAKNCRPYPQVEICHTAFEEWALTENAFDLAISADAFHWIEPKTGYPKIAAALKASGSAALFWNVPANPDTDWSRAIDAVYQEIAPQLDNPEKGFTVDWLIGIIKGNFAASGCFAAVDVRQYAQLETLTGEQYIKQLRTFSGHRGLDETTRRSLYARILNVIEQFGGSLTKPQLTVLFHAKVQK